MATLYIVATPIGNLDDITLRALNVLKSVDLIVSENPLITKRLLDKYKIKTPLQKFNEHASPLLIKKIMQRLNKGQDLAFVSDAGTPGIADPGGKLVQALRQNSDCNAQIIAIPGPSALTALLSISGFNTNRFLFLGFLPKKKKRQKFLTIIKDSPFPVVCYESVYRIEKLLKELDALGITEIIVGRELTKKFENIYTGPPASVISQLNKDKKRGEFVIAINKSSKSNA